MGNKGKLWIILIFFNVISRVHGSVCYRNEKLYVVNLSKDEQKHQLQKAKENCQQKIMSSSYPLQDTGPYCNMTFDNIMCWPYLKAGAVLSQSCPAYINGFNIRRSAKRICMENGEWYINKQTNTSWTDYTDCIKPPQPSIIQEHINKIRILYDVGYAVSLGSLFLAVIILVFLKKLHCERNTIHINLFLSFILRAVICFIKDEEFIPEGQVVVQDDNVHIRTKGSAIGCKVLYSLFHYLLTANYAWILIEGIHLHVVIFKTVHHKKRLLKSIIILGWSSPIVFIIPWVVVRALFEDSLCWSTHDTDNGFYWIIKGPIVLSIIVNFFLFINVIRVLFTKITASIIKNHNRYRKLAKSTLILIPLFGVHYITFISIPYCLDDNYQIIRLYIELTMTSFQGFIVALLFCFLNREVREEIRKKWKRRALRRRSFGSEKSHSTVDKQENSVDINNKITNKRKVTRNN